MLLKEMRDIVAFKLKDKFLLQAGAPHPAFIDALLNEGQTFVSEATFCNFTIVTETAIAEQGEYPLNTGVLQNRDIFLVMRALFYNKPIIITDQATLDRDNSNWRVATSGLPKYATIDFPNWFVLYPKPSATCVLDLTDAIKMILFLEPAAMLNDSSECKVDRRYCRYCVEYAYNTLTNNFQANEIIKQILNKERGKNIQRAIKTFNRKIGGQIDTFEV